MLIVIILIIVVISIIKYVYLYKVDYFSDYANTQLINWYSDENPQKNIDIKYKNTYYYEYDNQQYLQRLNDIFKPSHKERIPNDIGKLNLISDKASLGFILKKYDTFIDKIRLGIQKPELKITNTTEPIQIVSDKLIRWSLDRLLIEVILYRNNKFEGKKVLFYIDSYKNEILDIKITEQVSEDQIALYPVTPLNPFETEYDNANVVSSKDYDSLHWQKTSLLRGNIKDSDAKNPLIQKLLLDRSSLFSILRI